MCVRACVCACVRVCVGVWVWVLSAERVLPLHYNEHFLDSPATVTPTLMEEHHASPSRLSTSERVSTYDGRAATRTRNPQQEMQQKMQQQDTLTERDFLVEEYYERFLALNP